MIDVALTPADARPADVAVVIDVLRATSTVTQAGAAGRGGRGAMTERVDPTAARGH